MKRDRVALLGRSLSLVAGLTFGGELISPLSALAADQAEHAPSVTRIMDGSALAFALRFDRPINHYRSTLTLLTPDGTTMLGIRLSAQPNTLYVAVGQLQPGSYALRWQTPATFGETAAGTIPFAVAR